MISTYFTTTPSVTDAPPEVKLGSIMSLPPVKPWYLKNNFPGRLRNALRPINPDNACTLFITAAAGTELAGAYSRITVSPGHVRDVLHAKKQFKIGRASC